MLMLIQKTKNKWEKYYVYEVEVAASLLLAREIERVFDKKLSASYIRKIRRDQGNIFQIILGTMYLTIITIIYLVSELPSKKTEEGKRHTQAQKLYFRGI